MFRKEIRELKWKIHELERDVEVLKTAVRALQYEIEVEDKNREEKE